MSPGSQRLSLCLLGEKMFLFTGRTFCALLLLTLSTLAIAGDRQWPGEGHSQLPRPAPTHASLSPAKTMKKLANLQQMTCRGDLGFRDIEILWRDFSPYAAPSSATANSTAPPSGIIPSLLNTIFTTCCKDIDQMRFTYKQQASEDTDMEADVVYGAAVAGMPMTPPAQSSLQGRFVPVVQSPGAAYIVRNDYLPPNLVQLLTDTQYLLYFVLASAGVAGVCIWLLVSRKRAR